MSALLKLGRRLTKCKQYATHASSADGLLKKHGGLSSKHAVAKNLKVRSRGRSTGIHGPINKHVIIESRSEFYLDERP